MAVRRSEMLREERALGEGLLAVGMEREGERGLWTNRLLWLSETWYEDR